MSARLGELAVLQDVNPLGVPHRRETMGDDDH